LSPKSQTDSQLGEIDFDLEVIMETAVGVFASPEHAKEAVRELLASKVPKDAIVFLTRSGTDAEVVGKELSTGAVAGVSGVTAGAIAASVLLVPGIGGIVFGLGLGAATLLGLIGKESSNAVAAGNAEDADFFRNVLKQGRSLIVVRTESTEAARNASGILDRLGLSMQESTTAKAQTSVRHLGDIAVVDMVGRITFGEGNVMLRDTVRDLLAEGHKKILLNLQGVHYVDSAGIGEMVRTHATIRNQGGHLRLCNLTNLVNDLLQKTRLHSVFDIHPDEASAIQSIPASSSAKAGS
jgi:anti-sigma B factor antagonist